MSRPRILVFAYHEVGYACLDELIRHGQPVTAVFTHQDDPAERIWFPSVTELARRHGIPVYAPSAVNAPEWIEHIRVLAPELILSFYYRHLLSREILALPRLGAFNMHGSLLPKYRGRAPINWAIIHGETETGVTLHRMAARPDAGDIVEQETVPIVPRDTALDVFGKVVVAARAVLARQLDNLVEGRTPRIPQDESQATYFGGRRPEDGRIDWRESATAIFNLVRAVTHPYPGAFTDVDRRRLFVWCALPRVSDRGSPGEVLSVVPLRVAAGAGSLEIVRLQWDDAPEMDAATGEHGLRISQRLGTTISGASVGLRTSKRAE